MRYFSPGSDPDDALKKYLEQRDDLHAGRTPRVRGDRGDDICGLPSSAWLSGWF
ncbi:MAG TPA: hypothetical protein VH575_01205 [Gemmataceae bacterium]